jgi:glycerophosphoryl diester phosphodiesterase
MNKNFLGAGVMAHRGNMSEFPENTMVSFESAVALGSDWLELDIQRTKDGHLVVTHDASTKRVTGKDSIVTQATLAELRQLNFGAYRNDGKNYEAPLLKEVFDFAKSKNICVSVQPKNNGLVRDAIKLAKEAGMVDRIGFNDINCEYLIEVKQVERSIPVFWDRLPHTDFETDLFIAKKFGFETLMYLNEAITEEKFTKVKEAGIFFGACVINDVNDMKKYLRMGVDAFYTDYPAQLKALIHEVRKQ